MKNDSMLFFNSVNEFRSFVKELDIYEGWRIQSGLLNNRGKSIEDRRYVKYFRKLFEEKELFYRKVSLAEIVSWLDGYSLISRVFDMLERMIGSDTMNQISIYSEYMIKMSKRMRIDYVLEYDGKFLLLELRTVNHFDKIRPTWQKKFVELIVYKELLRNYISAEIRLYAFIALYEWKNNNLEIKHRKYNNDQIEYLCKYIIKFMIYKL